MTWYPPEIDAILSALAQQQGAPDMVERQVAQQQAIAEAQRQAVLANLGTLGGIGSAAPPVSMPMRRRAVAAPMRHPGRNVGRLRALMAAFAGAAGGGAGGWSQVHPPAASAGFTQIHPGAANPGAGYAQVPAQPAWTQVRPHLPWMLAR